MRNRVMPKVARGGIARQQGDKDPSTLCVPLCLKEQVTKIRARQPQGRGYAIGRNVLDGCREPENVGVRRIVQIGYRQSTRAPVGLQTKRYEWNLPFINRTDAIRERVRVERQYALFSQRYVRVCKFKSEHPVSRSGHSFALTRGPGVRSPVGTRVIGTECELVIRMDDPEIIDGPLVRRSGSVGRLIYRRR